MQRKFLEDLGLEKDVVDKIMSENGSDIEKTKARLEAERDNYKDQLETAQNALKEFDGVNVEEMKNKIAQLTSDMATKDAEHQAKIADMEFNSVLDSALSASRARNPKTVKALLDLEALKASKNQTEDIQTAIEAVKAENDYLFVSDTSINSQEPFHPIGAGDVDPSTNGKMNLTEAMKYANAHPGIDVKTLI